MIRLQSLLVFGNSIDPTCKTFPDKLMSPTDQLQGITQWLLSGQGLN